MHFSKNKEIQKTAKSLVRDCGWTARRGGNHICVYQPGTGIMLTIPSSPSCPRACMNWHAQLRRMIRAVNGVMPQMRGFA